MAIARQNGKLRGKQSRLKPAQDREIRRMHDSGDYNVAGIAALFSVSRPTVYRSLDRTAELPPLPAGTRPCPTSPSTTRCSPATPDNNDAGPRAADPGSRYIPYAPDNGTWHDAAEDQPWPGYAGPRRREDA